MRKINIIGICTCPVCGGREFTVVTNSKKQDFINAGDLVDCPRCGKTGNIDIIRGVPLVDWQPGQLYRV